MNLHRIKTNQNPEHTLAQYFETRFGLKYEWDGTTMWEINGKSRIEVGAIEYWLERAEACGWRLEELR